MFETLRAKVFVAAVVCLGFSASASARPASPRVHSPSRLHWQPRGFLSPTNARPSWRHSLSMRRTHTVNKFSRLIFFHTGIRPSHARAMVEVAIDRNLELGFRPIKWWKRIQTAMASLLGVQPKPPNIKRKVGLLGWLRVDKTRYRSDYDPIAYREPNGRILSNQEALEINALINERIGSEELQHGTHVTAHQVGLTRDDVGAPGDVYFISPRGSRVELAFMNSDESARVFSWPVRPAEERRGWKNRVAPRMAIPALSL
jgi:hypothetical protein